MIATEPPTMGSVRAGLGSPEVAELFRGSSVAAKSVVRPVRAVTPAPAPLAVYTMELPEVFPYEYAQDVMMEVTRLAPAPSTVWLAGHVPTAVLLAPLNQPKENPATTMRRITTTTATITYIEVRLIPERLMAGGDAGAFVAGVEDSGAGVEVATSGGLSAEIMKGRNGTDFVKNRPLERMYQPRVRTSGTSAPPRVDGPSFSWSA